jgi:hypothetical protein
VPFPNYHSARITNPSNFIGFRYSKNRGGDGIDFVYGIKKEKGVNGGKTELQAIRFNIDNFTPTQAKDWLKNNDKKYIKFEKSTSVKENTFEDYVEKLIE